MAWRINKNGLTDGKTYILRRFTQADIAQLKTAAIEGEIEVHQALYAVAGRSSDPDERRRALGAAFAEDSRDLFVILGEIKATLDD